MIQGRKKGSKQNAGKNRIQALKAEAEAIRAELFGARPQAYAFA